MMWDSLALAAVSLWQPRMNRFVFVSPKALAVLWSVPKLMLSLSIISSFFVFLYIFLRRPTLPSFSGLSCHFMSCHF